MLSISRVLPSHAAARTRGGAGEIADRAERFGVANRNVIHAREARRDHVPRGFGFSVRDRLARMRGLDGVVQNKIESRCDAALVRAEIRIAR